MTTYPPSPWRLTAHAYVGLYLVPKAQLPAPHSAQTKAVTFFGRGVVAAAFFVYEDPSPLTYNEIMSTVLVHRGWRPYVSITGIWVDSEASRDGGRELWAIPKKLAGFGVNPHRTYVASVATATIGSLVVRRSRRLPFPIPLRFQLAQDRTGDLVTTIVSGRGRAGVAGARWTFSPDGPLGFLAGRRPVLTLALRPLRLVFGR